MRLAIITLLLITTPAWATSYFSPPRRDVFSSNGSFVLDVDPETEVHTVYDARDRTKPLWSFSGPVWHERYLLSDDGSVVAIVAWEHFRVEGLNGAVCVEFRDRAGILASYPFEQLCPDPARTWLVGRGPIGDFWRTWYTKVEQDGDTFRVRTTDLYEYTFDLTDGSIVRRRLVPTNLLYKPGSYAVLVVVTVAGLWARSRWRRARDRQAPEERGLA